ncbi:MAG: extracellular solute-binding protein [Tepidisphaeraceae bacterium]
MIKRLVGRVNTLLVILLCAGCASTTSNVKTAQSDVLVYSGPNMRTSLETLAKSFEAHTGRRVTVVADDVRPLIARIARERAAGQRGPDLFCTHDPFLTTLIASGQTVREAWTVASLEPVIVVPKGNPQHIASLRDFARTGLRVGLTDSTQTISGEIVRVMFRRAGVADAVEKNVVVKTMQGRDLCKALLAGECDVGIVWNAVVAGDADAVDAIPIEPTFRPQRGVDAEVNSPTLGRLELDYVRVSIALLDASTNDDLARQFVEWTRSPDGAAVFLSNGFSPPAPDRPALPR